ncbi:hypothetical protein FHS85_004973 [Rhodoligotrophos appendicifer]|uniref:hypothetical protein n=1 Tax=Rhodoligotrophos appendicifer TaxID=987056 RepID=UPI001184F6B0|nr:hypothetical protein [Rhodoligotrophos appendicifer]
MNLSVRLSALDKLRHFGAPASPGIWAEVKTYDRAHPRPSKRCALSVGKFTLKQTFGLGLIDDGEAAALPIFLHLGPIELWAGIVRPEARH